MSVHDFGIRTDAVVFPGSAFEALEVVTAPTGLVVTLNEQKRHMRVESQEEDATIDVFLRSAMDWAETFLNRQLLTATYCLHLRDFPRRDDLPIELPRPPLRSVASVLYYDTDGVQQTWAASNYQVDTVSAPGRLMPVPDGSYPEVQDDRFGAVQVNFDAGYGERGDVPDAIKLGIRMLAATHFERREDDIVASVAFQVPRGVESVLRPYRIEDLP